jgi:hypothetical protein
MPQLLTNTVSNSTSVYIHIAHLGALCTAVPATFEQQRCAHILSHPTQSSCGFVCMKQQSVGICQEGTPSSRNMAVRCTVVGAIFALQGCNSLYVFLGLGSCMLCPGQF